jgi:hypothetical protein
MYVLENKAFAWGEGRVANNGGKNRKNGRRKNKNLTEKEER